MWVVVFLDDQLEQVDLSCLVTKTELEIWTYILVKRARKGSKGVFE